MYIALKRLILLILALASAAPAAAAQSLGPFGSRTPVWLAIHRDSAGGMIAVDSASLSRSADSTFLASTLAHFADTLSAESGERFDAEIDVQELACGGAKIRSLTSFLMLGDSVVATIPLGGFWKPVEEQEAPLFDARCAFLLASFVMIQPVVNDVMAVTERPALINGGVVSSLVGRLYREVASPGNTEPTVVASFVIDEQGIPNLATLSVISSDVPLIGTVIERIVSRMRFRPARVDDKPVPVRVQLPITFERAERGMRDARDEPQPNVPSPPAGHRRGWDRAP